MTSTYTMVTGHGRRAAGTAHAAAPRRAHAPAWLLGAAAALVLALPQARAGVDVGVSVQISQPGVYGRVDIGRFPQPQLIVAQPVIVRPAPVRVVQQPVYLWVPPGHRKNWRKHCGDYGACGVPVYFVRHDWYGHHVHPAKAKGGPKGRGPGHARGDDRRYDSRHGHRHDARYGPRQAQGGPPYGVAWGPGPGRGPEGRQGRGRDRD